MLNIAVLGLGAMGSRMAKNLINAGHRVTVWNRTPDAMEPLLAAGANAALSPKDAALAANVVISMVRDDEASKSVWLDSQHGAFSGIRKGSICIECSTISYDWMLQLGEAARQHGVEMLDAPVSGSRPQAEAGELVFLVGGSESAADIAAPALLAMGSSVNRVGPLGAGMMVKLATNALLGVQVAALGELYGLFTANGIDLQGAFDAIGATSVASLAAQRSAASMLASNFTPQFPVSLVEKDLGYALEAARGVSTPSLSAVRGVFSKAVEQGLGDKNMTAVVEMYKPGR